MQAEMEGPEMHMKLEGKMVSILTKLDRKLYKKYIRHKKGRFVMYVKVKKNYTAPYRQHFYFGKISPPHWNLGVSQ